MGKTTKNGDRDHYNTPPDWIEPARAMWRGRIALDPFSNPTSFVGAEAEYCGPEVDGRDGFVLPFLETNFINGPWSRSKAVVERIVEQWMDLACEVIAVIPVVANTSYWHLVDEAPAKCTPDRRVQFWWDGEPTSSNRTDVVLGYFGHDIYRFRAHYRHKGRITFG